MEGVVFKKNKLIGWDYGSKEGDIGCEIYGRWNKKGELIIEDVKFIKPKKEVKKMSRPYFKTKVVKVKKEEKCKMFKKCHVCGQEYTCMVDKNQPKGNWVNGENLDKIKFPCFCRFNYNGKKCYGEINKTYYYDNDIDKYTISNITNQVDGKTTGEQYSVIYTNESFKELIEIHDVHILKGKIIIYEEE